MHDCVTESEGNTSVSRYRRNAGYRQSSDDTPASRHIQHQYQMPSRIIWRYRYAESFQIRSCVW